MADGKIEELGKHGKRKASTTEELGDGPSSFPSFSSSSCEGKGQMADDGNVDEVEDAQDPLVVCGPEIMTVMLSKLDARSVALARLVSRGWLALASTDKIWASKDILYI